MLIGDRSGYTAGPVVPKTKGQTVILILTFLLYHRRNVQCASDDPHQSNTTILL